MATAAAATAPRPAAPVPHASAPAAAAIAGARASGACFVFHFCPVCGTTLFHTEAGVDDAVTVAIGAFADPAFLAPEVSVYGCRRHAWVTLPPGVEAFERDP